LVVNDREIAGSAAARVEVFSPAFVDGGSIPPRYTADGGGLSPPLVWSGVPEKAEALVLLIEDADSPTMHPLVHGIASLGVRERRLQEGALPGPAGAGAARPMGRNSFLRTQYLPPDPPPGHGPHRYAFEVFALDAAAHFDGPPGRGRLLDELRRHVIAKGCLIGTYQRA
jgi:Raf kinase inhibitor-like YbhB/YbcL family protein